jgi:ABC-type multidrug transport system fused ATPase/permease subunit
VKERKNATVAPPFQGQISIHNIGFRYGDGPEVLKDVSFRVEVGQLVGIVGANGAGKSTLMALIPRLYDPVSGKVKIDGENIKHFTLDSLREQIGIVLQQPILFGTTIRENIAYGKPEATQDEIEAAARAADIHAFISSLPDGYDTEVAEGGVSLSGGQRQKICIARAIIKDPPILLLDEPTSGLDTASSAEVNATLNRIRRGKTSFRVAHRLEDVQHADLILVLSGGRLIESGSHAQLARGGGWYQRIFDLQTSAGADMLEAAIPAFATAVS